LLLWSLNTRWFQFAHPWIGHLSETPEITRFFPCIKETRDVCRCSSLKKNHKTGNWWRFYFLKTCTRSRRSWSCMNIWKAYFSKTDQNRLSHILNATPEWILRWKASTWVLYSSEQWPLITFCGCGDGVETDRGNSRQVWINQFTRKYNTDHIAPISCENMDRRKKPLDRESASKSSKTNIRIVPDHKEKETPSWLNMYKTDRGVSSINRFRMKVQSTRPTPDQKRAQLLDQNRGHISSEMQPLHRRYNIFAGHGHRPDARI
jgi:hypothetical protein